MTPPGADPPGVVPPGTDPPGVVPPGTDPPGPAPPGVGKEGRPPGAAGLPPGDAGWPGDAGPLDDGLLPGTDFPGDDGEPCFPGCAGLPLPCPVAGFRPYEKLPSPNPEPDPDPDSDPDPDPDPIVDLAGLGRRLPASPGTRPSPIGTPTSGKITGGEGEEEDGSGPGADAAPTEEDGGGKEAAGAEPNADGGSDAEPKSDDAGDARPEVDDGEPAADDAEPEANDAGPEADDPELAADDAGPEKDPTGPGDTGGISGTSIVSVRSPAISFDPAVSAASVGTDANPTRSATMSTYRRVGPENPEADR